MSSTYSRGQLSDDAGVALAAKIKWPVTRIDKLFTSILPLWPDQGKRVLAVALRMPAVRDGVKEDRVCSLERFNSTPSKKSTSYVFGIRFGADEARIGGLWYHLSVRLLEQGPASNVLDGVEACRYE